MVDQMGTAVKAAFHRNLTNAVFCCAKQPLGLVQPQLDHIFIGRYPFPTLKLLGKLISTEMGCMCQIIQCNMLIPVLVQIFDSLNQ